MLTLTVEAFEDTLDANKNKATELAMRLNCKVKFTFEGKVIIVDAFGVKEG